MKTISLVLGSMLLATFSVPAMAQNWEPVTGAENLKALFSDTVQTATLKDGVTATATYNRDGSGQLVAWGDKFDRRWEVRGDDEVCIHVGDKMRCFNVEVDPTNPKTYRGVNVANRETVIFVVSESQVSVTKGPSGAEGGAAEPSAEEMAAKLANPNTPLASLTLKYQFRTFKGDLPDADAQSGTTFLFQPSFPFSLENGDVVFFRPGIPLQIESPAFDAGSMGFKSVSGIGDIAFDLAYGRTTKAGILFAGGLISSLPTATDNKLGSDRLTLGPELLIGKLSKTYVIGAFPNHQWDIAGSGDVDISLTSVQLFGIYLPGGGWSYGTSPILTYDHISENWTVPLNLTIGSTQILRGRPWKFGIEINYYVEQPDSFGPDWFFGFSVAPVVENVFATWLQ